MDGTTKQASLYIADTSAWKQARRPEVAEQWSEMLRNNQVATTPIVIFELLLGTAGEPQFLELCRLLESLRSFSISPDVEELALDTMTRLVKRNPTFHRVKVPDLLISAVASKNGVGVLHYDHHYDRLAQELDFESRWIAEPGTL